MSWAGQVTVYTPAGDVMWSFETETLIVTHSWHACPVRFEDAKRKLIMETSLPFILDCPEEIGPWGKPIDWGKAEHRALLIGVFGKTVRAFLYSQSHVYQFLQYYILPNGKRVITNFPTIQQQIKTRGKRK